MITLYLSYACLIAGRKSVEVLLQQMFEGEINPEDDGDENTYNLRQRTLTLEEVA